ncbi:MAG: alpha/beta hydrolase [SAR202 cluster bacterium]|nr:alpha/beta hydrolase [SAR202 cluster bacterium]
MPSTPVSFYSDGHKIAAVLHTPEHGAGGPHPAIVMAQGTVGRKELFGFPRIAQRFNALGYVTLTFDYRGFGESEGERGRLFPQEQAENIRDAVTFLAQQPGVDARRVTAWGTSFGGATVVQVAALDQRIAAVVSIVGYGDGERWLRGKRAPEQWTSFVARIAADRNARVRSGVSELVPPGEVFAPDPKSAEVRARVVGGPPGMDVRMPSVTLQSAERMLEFKPVELVERIAPRPVLFVAAEHDAPTPADGIVDLYWRARGPKRLEIVPGITHYEVYAGPHASRLLDWTDTWLRDHGAGPSSA